MSFSLTKNKQYGLITKKDSNPPLKKLSIFESDDEDDNIKKKINTEGEFVRMETKLVIEKAIADNPKCFEYDDIYDEMHKAKKEEKAKPKDLKSRYIGGMVKNAENRKKHLEIVQERANQRERELEGDKFADKEKFETEAYKAKKAERLKLEESEKQQEAKDELEKSKDIFGMDFYLNILNSRVGESKEEDDQKPDNQKSKKEDNHSHERKIRPKTQESEDESPRSGKRRRSRSPSPPRRNKTRRSDSEDRNDRHVEKSRHDKRSRDDSRRRRKSRSNSRGRCERRTDKSRNDERSPARRENRHEREERRRRSPEHHKEDRRRSHDRQSESKKEKEVAVEVKKDEVQVDKKDEVQVDRKAKRNTGESLDDAKARYLARKAANTINPIISKK